MRISFRPAAVIAVLALLLDISARCEDFTYTTNNGTITITGYVGPDDVIIPSTINGLLVTAIGDRAFYACDSLTTITFPNSITTIGNWAFSDCTSLTTITLPNSVTSIGYAAFSHCTYLANITMPDSLISIGENAFYDCRRLTGITLPNSVTTIGEGAFEDCRTLTSITIPNGVTAIMDDTFNSCSSLTNVTLPNSVTTIGDYAFAFSSLASISLPDSLINLGEWAFFWCSSLMSIEVAPGNQTYSSLGGVLFNKNQTTLICYPDDKFGSSYTIPDTVTSIGDHAFFYCTNLTSITILAGVTSIGDRAFSLCLNLTSIEVAPGNQTYSSLSGVLFNKPQTTLIFYPEGKLESSYTIPNSVTTIGDGAFLRRRQLRSITIPNSVTTIGEEAFFECSSLINMSIPNSVISIGDYAFSGCSSLASITIPNSITSIGDGAFSYCTSLTSITIPNSVLHIGDGAFYRCSRLWDVYFEGNAPTVGSNAFTDTPNPTIYYLPGTVGWVSTFADCPTAPWFLPGPVILTTVPNFGIQANQFRFRISWATSGSVVVEASRTLANPVWSPVSTNTLINGWSDFSDTGWESYTARFYRIRWP